MYNACTIQFFSLRVQAQIILMLINLPLYWSDMVVSIYGFFSRSLPGRYSVHGTRVPPSAVVHGADMRSGRSDCRGTLSRLLFGVSNTAIRRVCRITGFLHNRGSHRTLVLWISQRNTYPCARPRIPPGNRSLRVRYSYRAVSCLSCCLEGIQNT